MCHHVGGCQVERGKTHKGWPRPLLVKWLFKNWRLERLQGSIITAHYIFGNFTSLSSTSILTKRHGNHLVGVWLEWLAFCKNLWEIPDVSFLLLLLYSAKFLRV